MCSLSDFFRNMASGMLSSYDGEGSVLYDVEIKHGLLQVPGCLAFSCNQIMTFVLGCAAFTKERFSSNEYAMYPAWVGLVDLGRLPT